MTQNQITQTLIKAQDLAAEMSALLALGRSGFSATPVAEQAAHEYAVEALRDLAKEMGFELTPVSAERLMAKVA